MTGQTTKVALPDEVISFAQNREDLILLWLLGQKKDGFYVDVGANDPSLFSVTKLFYEMGWSGLNIEPIKECFEKLLAYRPRDINLNLGAAEKTDTISFREYKQADGLSTFSGEMKETLGSTHEFLEYEVEVKPLRDIFRDNLPSNTKIDFMKVDVEGFEYQVLAGNDWNTYRPAILCIEANHVYKDWRPMLLDAGYGLAFFDGLNEYWAEDAAAVKKNYKDYADIFLSGRTIEQERDFLSRARLKSEVSTLRGINDRLTHVNQTLDARVAQMQSDIDYLNNLTIRMSLRQLAKSIYRSVRFRILVLIWGKRSGYQNSPGIITLSGQVVSTTAQAKSVIDAINDSDKQNSALLFRHSKIRQFIYERLRQVALVMRKGLRSPKGVDNV